MSRSKSPSQVRTPNQIQQWTFAIDFLISRFPQIDRATWQNRMARKLVHWQTGEPLDELSPYKANATILYYREVTTEPVIPFQHEIIYQDNEIIVADKPHFLPVTPGGKYVNECLLNRIRREFDNEQIVPIHRLDKDTAGLVMFSQNPSTRGLYTQLFSSRQIEKSYHAVAEVNARIQDVDNKVWHVENHIKRGNPGFLWTQCDYPINSHSEIQLKSLKRGLGMFHLIPHSGKTHQLRLHMMSIGMPILNDRFYPDLLPYTETDRTNTTSKAFDNPLQLLAFSLKFLDPLNGVQHTFYTKKKLSNWQN